MNAKVLYSHFLAMGPIGGEALHRSSKPFAMDAISGIIATECYEYIEDHVK